ncbi:MAG: cyclic pyranopterin monophosphate synthase MoaC [Myxococcota bacterium]
MSELTHIDADGNARMVEVSEKPITLREATAEGFIAISDEALKLVRSGASRKGDVLAVAQLAGIGGAKQTGTLVPLCHPIPLTAVDVRLEPREGGVHCVATVKAEWRTGVEMEALTAVSTALLTVYDMLKAVDRGMTIGPIRLLEKRGGTRGDYVRT